MHVFAGFCKVTHNYHQLSTSMAPSQLGVSVHVFTLCFGIGLLWFSVPCDPKQLSQNSLFISAYSMAWNRNCRVLAVRHLSISEVSQVLRTRSLDDVKTEMY